MEFQYYDLGQCKRGDVIEVTLKGNAANVRLLNSTNFNNFKNGRNHRYIGGLIKRSPVQLQVPSSGRWYVTVDMIGLRGSTRSSVRRIPGPLPTLQETPLREVPGLVRDELENVTYDVFISHASEDKDSVVRDLANALIDCGLRVWYDEFELRIGDSLRRKIDHGLANSRLGLVVLSRSFIAKGWTNYELDGIVTRSVSDGQKLLPIWHDITKAEVMAYSPTLADKVARLTAVSTVDEIAQEIADLLES